MIINRLLSTLAISALCCFSGSARAEVKFHSVFSDNMVLQRDRPLPVWGRATAGEEVTISLADRKATTRADAQGNWKVKLQPMPVARELNLSATSGADVVRLKNVAVGDVYICSGQSNMEWSVGASNNPKEEIAAANYPDIRLLTVPKKVAPLPQQEFGGKTMWQVCSPDTVARFSGVGYFFGRELHQKLGVPIGLINASWGGTIAETWTSREALTELGPTYQERLARLDEIVAERAKVPFDQAEKEWWQQSDAGTRETWQNADYDSAAWPTMHLPGAIETAAPNFDGIVWFRREVTIPDEWAGKDLNLRLGLIDEQDMTYFNGVPAGWNSSANAKRTYMIPAARVKAGRAVIAIRVVDNGGPGGVLGNTTGRGEDLRLELKRDAAKGISLAGPWQYQLSSAKAALTPFPQNWEGSPNQTSVLFNGMISPLLPFAVRGAIWYQGESNAGNATAYRSLFPALIRDWRTQWNAKQDGSEFGFYFVQLANFMARVEEPVQSGWAELRDAQTSALSVPRTGMASAIEIGEAVDIHPRNKQDVGKRLALAAMAKEYGLDVEYSGPMFAAMTIRNNEVLVDFSHAAGLKTTDGAAPRAFAIAGENGKWVAANAQIEGEKVLLSSALVPEPKAVRYAWSNNPDVNLVNAAGLPANPFRTDAPR